MTFQINFLDCFSVEAVDSHHLLGLYLALAATIEAASPALVSWGWNEGRNGTAYVQQGRSTLSVPVTGRSGRNNFFIRSLAGGAITLGATEMHRHIEER